MHICYVFAHPDDEAFGVAGSMARYAGRGVGQTLVCATRGEAGQSGGLAETSAELARVRSAELACAARFEGITALEILPFPDGGADRWDLVGLEAELQRVLASCRPEVVITFDREGITRHPDHIAVHQAVTGLVMRHGAALGVRRLFYQVIACPDDAGPEPGSLVCHDAGQIDVSVDIRAYETLKREALRCHRSQAADTALLLEAPTGSLSAEHYRLGWSVDGAGLPAGARCLLDGLRDGGEAASAPAPARRLVLASGSPRRKALLAALGVAFDACAADVDESPLPGEPPEQLVRRLSRAKAAAALAGRGGVVLAADTVVVIDGRVLGKPSGPGDAVSMLMALRDRQHQVFTSVTVARGDELSTRLSRSLVRMRPYSQEEALRYVASGDALDKAGAYAIQHPLFSPVAGWSGCYAGIMGLPLGDTAALLLEAGVAVPHDVVTVCEGVAMSRPNSAGLAGSGRCCLRSGTVDA